MSDGMKDLIKQLRETPSRSKRELLDKAADAIEDLTDWRDASVEVPVKEIVCNVIVNGTYGNLTFQDAVCQANWYEDEGWILEAFPEWENPDVTYWLPVPPLPKKNPAMACQKCGEPAPYSQFLGGYVCPCGYVTRKEG